MRDWVDTPGFVQGGSSTRLEVRRFSPLRGPTSSQASAALGAPPQRDSPVRAARRSPARTQAPQADSSDRKERTTQAVPPSPRRTRPMVTCRALPLPHLPHLPLPHLTPYPTCCSVSGLEPGFGGTSVSFIRVGAPNERQLSSFPSIQ